MRMFYSLLMHHHVLIYPSYPPKMIPGCHITIGTDATSNKDARLLLQAIGLPFYGKLND